MAVSTSSSPPFTFELDRDLYEGLVSLRAELGMPKMSNLVEYALSQMSGDEVSKDRPVRRQISVRLGKEARDSIRKLSQNGRFSGGDVMRVALASLVQNPPAREQLTPPMTTHNVKKKTATKKAVSAKKTAAPAKKAAAPKAPAKKAAGKKIAVKKVASKKASAPPAKKAVKAVKQAVKAAKKATKSAAKPATKPAAKSAAKGPAKKAVAAKKSAPRAAKKAVKKAKK